MTRQLERIEDAAACLRSGEVVAFPTETVYGLGARFDDAQAVARVFAAKGRPSDNPLIVHCSSWDDIPRVAAEITPAAQQLMRRFSPGPLTVILPRSTVVPDIVTAGLETVAVRIPRHPVAQQLIQAVGVPLVAPSANRSGSPSPTTWQAVWEDLSGRIAAVLCGPPTEIGLESTVVDCSDTSPGARPLLLRSGAVTLEQLREVWPDLATAALTDAQRRRSPGLRHRHYAPRARVILFDEIDRLATDPDAFCLSLQPHPHAAGFRATRVFAGLAEYAGGLYESMREADRDGAARIYCQRVGDEGLGRALMDRLARAAE